MCVHIIPHGRVTEHVKRSLRGYDAVDRVYLLPSVKFAETGRDFAEYLEQFGYEVEAHEVNAFEMRSVVDSIVSIAKDHPEEEELYVNITGGTNLMAGAVTSSAFFIGAIPTTCLNHRQMSL